MKIKRSWFVVISAVVILILLLTTRLHFVLESLLEVQALGKSNELYILVQHSYVVSAGTAIPLVVKGLLGLPPPDMQRVRTDMIIGHVSTNGLKAAVVRDFDWGGSCFPYKGTLHFARGGDHGGIWRWTGSTFLKLEHSEASEILNSRADSDEVIKSAGWTRKTGLKCSKYDISYTFKVGDRHVQIIPEWKKDSDGKEKVIIRGVPQSAADTTLAEANFYHKYISKAAYDELKKSSNFYD